MKVLGSTTSSAKNAIRQMARNDLIAEPESWLKFIDGRNETSHSYDDKIAQRVYLMVTNFLPHAKQLMLMLQKQLV